MTEGSGPGVWFLLVSRSSFHEGQCQCCGVIPCTHLISASSSLGVWQRKKQDGDGEREIAMDIMLAHPFSKCSGEKSEFPVPKPGHFPGASRCLMLNALCAKWPPKLNTSQQLHLGLNWKTMICSKAREETASGLRDNISICCVVLAIEGILKDPLAKH